MEKLAFWGYVDPVETTHLQFGPVAPGSSDDVRLRVANLSQQLTAGGVSVAASGSAAAQLYLSLDGDTFGDSITLGDLPASSLSAPFWVRRVTPGSAAGDYTANLRAAAERWYAAAPTTDQTT